jgi:hypothetical protein
MAEKIHGGTTPINPWWQEDKVVCVEMTNIHGLPYSDGSVWLFDGTDVTVRD